MTTRDEEKSCKLVKDWKAFKEDILDADQEKAYLAEIGLEDEEEPSDPAEEGDVIAVVDTLIEELDNYVSGRKSDEIGSEVDDEGTRDHRRRILGHIRNLRMK